MNMASTRRLPITNVDSLTNSVVDSLNGIDAVPPSGERTPLLDVESVAPTSGRSTPYGIVQGAQDGTWHAPSTRYSKRTDNALQVKLNVVTQSSYGEQNTTYLLSHGYPTTLVRCTCRIWPIHYVA